ncbi:MAG: NUDIX domain-containing protein [Anaerosacchariphilus sp.]
MRRPTRAPEDCLLRETFEETGLTLTDYRFRGIVTFALKGVETQYMCLYTATGWDGELDYNCREGVLEWIPKDKIDDLELWVGDKVFFKLLAQEAPFFSLKLTYDGDTLEECVLDGKALDWLKFLDNGCGTPCK